MKFPHFPRFTLTRAALFAGLFGLAGQAGAVAVSCDGCSNELMEQRAYGEVLSFPIPSDGEIYVTNRVTGAAGKFYYVRFYGDANGGFGDCSGLPDAPPCIPVTTLGAIKVEPEVTTYMGYMKAAAEQTVWTDTRSDLPQNAYEAVGFPQKAANVDPYLSTSSIAGFINELKQQLQGFPAVPYFNGEGVRVTIPVRLADGSTALYFFNRQTGKWERLPNSTKDKNGNIVPESVQAVSGGVNKSILYNFSNNETDHTRFVQLMNHYQIPISGPDQSRIMVCSGSEQGGRLVVRCVYQ